MVGSLIQLQNVGRIGSNYCGSDWVGSLKGKQARMYNGSGTVAHTITSNALSGLAGKCLRMLLHMQQRAAGDVIAAVFKLWLHIKDLTRSVVIWRKCCQISSRSDLKRQNF